VTRANLIAHISDRFDLGEDVARDIVRELLKEMAQALSEGRRIEIRGFGSFDLTLALARIGRNPKTGGAVSVKAKMRPRFKVSKGLRGKLMENGSA
jgi:integration host factor subunit beta